jgi:hypothetical protein
MTDTAQRIAVNDASISKQARDAVPVFAVCLVTIGGDLTLVWVTFLGWTAGKLTGLW